jgi:SRSO17 transposase
LPVKAVATLADRLQEVWSGFRERFQTKTRDTSEYAQDYLRGLLTMDRKRNYANIARRVIDPEDDGQNLQQFMSDSPWSAAAVFDQIQKEIVQRPALNGGMLALDESGDKRSGEQSAGAARQYLGRLGKVDLGQVGVGLSYSKAGMWTLVDAELFLPEVWFDDAHADLRRRWHIPAGRTFATKLALGLALIRRAKKNGLAFRVVGCDSVYGRDGAFRAAVAAEELIYMADIPCDQSIYLDKPVVGVPDRAPGTPGRPATRWQVLNGVAAVEARSVVAHPEWALQPVTVRHTERGLLTYPCAARRVWTITPDGLVRSEWLFVRREPDGTYSFSLSNAPVNTSVSQLAAWRSDRYFVERTFQDAKSEAGWDELVARKYRAWMHHTALDALALWFIAQVKLDWAQEYPRDPALAQQLEIHVLPALSMANVREMLKAVLPLKQLSPKQASRVVVKHLVNRSRSTRSRWKAQKADRGPD